MDVVEKRTNYLMRANRSWNIPLSSLFNHLNGKKNLGSLGQKVCLQNDDMDISYVRMWIVHKPTIAKDEGCITHTNKGYTILRWDMKHIWWYWFRHKHSK
jgi:hypothetical protein